MLTIKTLQGTHRMSTQDLLLAIEEAVGNGETSFEIEASGQHDIGGPLWNREGKALRFHVTNPGQRVGSMCLDNTEILVDGPAPADVGWLNAGGRIVVRGDAGDTAGHCAAAGVIHIGGRAGARSGSLMKHDPLYAPPELWVLKNVGSFSFEFMGGGKAVVCGYDCEGLPSVLGERPCVGMVGGIVYVRGAFSEDVADDLAVSGLESDDIAYLDAGLETFLSAVGRPELYAVLSDWSEWRKMYPLTLGGHSPRPDPMPMKAFRAKEWIQGGIFSDVCRDDFVVNTTVARGLYRQRVPSWDNAACAAPCEFRCPASIPTQLRYNLLRAGKVEEAYKLVLDYTPFPGSVCGGVCPNPCMEGCTRGGIDEAVQIGALGRCSIDVSLPRPTGPTGKKVAVIGGGVAGLSAAWRLARKGHEVTVYEADDRMGGKLLWPVMTKEITDGGLITADGTLISGDMVIITIGESPDLGYLPEGVRKFRDWVIPGADMSLLENVFAAGDVIKPGLLADAIGTGIKAAEAVDASLRGVAYAPVEKKPVPSGQLSTAYFTRCPHGELPAANRDFDRCVSCGTCRDCRMCLESCPEGAISRETLAGGAYRYVSDPDRCIGCGICSGVCPCGIWTMHPNVPLE